MSSLREVWDAQAAEWTRFARDPVGDFTNRLFNIPHFLELVPPPGRRTLDLGCGEGRVGAELARRGHSVVGVDSSPGMVRAACELIEAIVAEAASLPFDDQTFDGVVAFMSLQDMDDLAAVVRETARVLESGGWFCFAVTHPINTAGRFERKSGDAPFVIRGSYLAPRRLDDVVERDGFRIHFACLHRPLEAYSRAIEDCGLVIDAIREPRLDQAAARTRDALARWQRVPLFLHARARKP